MKYYYVYLLCLLVRYGGNLPGVWRIKKYVSKAAAKTFTTKNIKKTTLLCGIVMEVDLQDHNGRYLFIHGHYEFGTTRLFNKILKPNDNVLDIGANLGFFSFLSSTLVGNSGEVYSFEASPVLSKKLQDNISLNQIKNITLYEKAVSNKNEQLTFYQAQDQHTGISSLRNLQNECKETFQVESTTIDNMVDQFEKIKLIKIDIEGAEHQALEGMQTLLNRDKPYIILELTDEFLREFNSSSLEVTNFLSDAGYYLFKIDYDHVSALTDDLTNQCNILASPVNEAV